MNLVVGAPVHERMWILPYWLSFLHEQTAVDPGDITLLFHCGPSVDGTREYLEAQRGADWRDVIILDGVDGEHSERRTWNKSRFHLMVQLRNELLAEVRRLRPDYYLSCDTDMLLPLPTVETLLKEIGTYDGIAPLAFMTSQGEDFSNGTDVDCSRRLPIEPQTYPVGACFGVVLMTPQLYDGVDYAFHDAGEDLGWARGVQQAGLSLAICPLCRVKHVMDRPALETRDHRVGF
jgi:hypothetical protein